MVVKPQTLMERAEDEKLLRELDKAMRIIVLVQGIMANDKAGYAYVLMRPEQYEAFEHARQIGAHNVAEFGEVIAHGEGLEPPQETQNWVEERFGADHLFQYKLVRLMEESAAFGE